MLLKKFVLHCHFSTITRPDLRMRVRTFFCIAQAFERKFKIFIFYLLFNAAKNRILTDVRSPCATDHIDARQKIRFEEHGAVVRARCRRSYMLFRAFR